tara:strand:+ start:756 stop:1820 length:1065 start_codon:yes stop_codon:yes gene_type:complete
MSLIRDKKLKKFHSDSRNTIDQIHNDIIQQKKNKIRELENKRENETHKTIKSKLQNKIKNANNELYEYYFKNSELLNQYYNDDYNIQKTSIDTSSSILNFFDNTKKNKQGKPHNNNIVSKYLSNVDDTQIYDYSTKIDTNICKQCKCKVEYNPIESILLCKNCGFTEYIIVTNDNIYDKDHPKEINYFSYKRINHFNEWLTQFQAKENTNIPNEIYKRVSDEIKKYFNLRSNNINYTHIRDILKKLGYNKYYEHIPNILNVLTGKMPPTINPNTEEILRSMFKEIQPAFSKHCPKERKNFLSYSYVLYKFCELLELDELLPHFNLLKSREKLQQQDFIWEKMCGELKWEYIPSI